MLKNKMNYINGENNKMKNDYVNTGQKDNKKKICYEYGK